jgi:hypothetical protein
MNARKKKDSIESKVEESDGRPTVSLLISLDSLC